MNIYRKYTTLALVIMAVLLVAGFYVLHRPVIRQSPGAVYDLQAGRSKRTVIRELSQQGVIKHPYVLSLYTYLHPVAQLKAGEYLFPQNASLVTIWKQITTGTGLYYRQFMIIPGWTFAQLRQVLQKTPALKQTLADVTNQQIMEQLGYANVSPEGEFMPETYNYTKGDTDISILKRSFTLMQNKFGELWLNRTSDLPYNTPYKALIAASLVEREAFLNSERPVIAGVIINRLNKGMLLQIDPTVIFGMGDKYDGNITKKDLLTDTPYNTYTRKGLPPTPIGMPSVGAIEAVLHPQQHDYYYFVAKGDGSHQFSKTLDEHHAAVANTAAARKQKRFFNESRVRDYLFYRLG